MADGKKASRAIAQRIREVLAEEKISERELARRSGLAEPHVGLMLTRLDAGRSLEVATLLAVARGAGRSFSWLVEGREEEGGFRLSKLPAWDELRVSTRLRYPDLPDFTIAVVGDMVLSHPPDRLDASAIRDLARAWFDAASDDVRAAAENAFVKARADKKRP